MSSREYNDMFLKCQKTAPYHVFTFDIVDSKKMDKETFASFASSRIVISFISVNAPFHLLL